MPEVDDYGLVTTLADGDTLLAVTTQGLSQIAKPDAAAQISAAEAERAQAAEALLAPLDSPDFTGSPTAPTQTSGDSSTKLATTAFVADAVSAGGGGGATVVSGADPTGGTDSTAAIQTALLSFGTLGGASQGDGGTVILPPGNYKVSKPLVVPSAVTLDGLGAAQVTLATGSDCDVIQFATAGSTDQATILGVSASDIANAFYAGVKNLNVHGDSFSTTTPGYRHGISCITNPLTTAAAGDPDFDPLPTVENVRIKACTGDGWHHEGRSGAFLKRVTAQNCNGIGIVPSFDSTMVDCLSVNNQAGGYFNHTSNIGSGCKFYNNNDLTWVSGTSYAAGNVVVDSGAMYFCILAVTGSTAPGSDATHWTELTDATAPQANGNDWYWDTGAGGHNWTAIESQEASRGGFYFKGPNAGPIHVTGQCGLVNFNNGQANYDSGNPGHYAAVTFDGVSNVSVFLNSISQGGGAGIVCTSLNSPGSNTLIAVTDGTEAALFNGDNPGFSLVNGAVYGSTPSGGTAPLVAYNEGTGTYTRVFDVYAPNIPDGNFAQFHVGRSNSFGDAAELGFTPGSTPVFALGMIGSQGIAYDSTNKVWTGSAFVVRNVLDDGSGNMAVTGNIAAATAGSGVAVKEGSDAKQGTATLTAGSAVVSNTSVTTDSRIFLTGQADGGTPGFLRVSARTAGTSFTITSSSATDASTVAYEIFEPA